MPDDELISGLRVFAQDIRGRWADGIDPAFVDECAADRLSALQARNAELERDAQTFGKVVGVLYMGAGQSDRSLIAEACRSLRVTFPDGEPFASLKPPPIDAALSQEPTRQQGEG